MSTPAAKLFVLVAEDFTCVKIVGRASFSSSIDFKTLINELLQKGYHYFVLELSECLLMDSTFLGVLAGFGLKLTREPGAQPGIELLNPNARVGELLENLGVLHLFKITHGALPAPEQAELRPCSPLSPSKDELTQACLQAHRTLIDINPGNVSKFKEVAQFLAEDMKKLRGAQE